MKRNLIAALSMLIVLGIFAGCGNASENRAAANDNGMTATTDESQESNDESSDTEELSEADTLSQYDFVGVARYGSLPVGVSFLLPERDGYSDIAVTLHGTSHFGVTRNIWINTLLSGADVPIEEIPAALQKEYKDEKYWVDIDGFRELTDTSWFMQEGDMSTMPELAFKKADHVKIGNIDAFYFETDFYLDTLKTVGYSFFFDGKPICIYAELDDFVSKVKTDEVQKIADELEWYIASMESYSGESFMELDNTSNFSSHIYDGYSNDIRIRSEEMDIAGKTLFTINLPWYPGMNQDKTAVDIKNNFFPGFTAENALETIAASEEWRHAVGSLSYYSPQENAKVEGYDFTKNDFDILKKENVTVNGYDFTKYVCQLSGKGSQNAFVVYTMVFEELLYAFEYAWDYIYSTDPAAEDYLSPEQVDTLMKTLEYSALSSINTIRTAESEDDILSYVHYF